MPGGVYGGQGKILPEGLAAFLQEESNPQARPHQGQAVADERGGMKTDILGCAQDFCRRVRAHHPAAVQDAVG